VEYESDARHSWNCPSTCFCFAGQEKAAKRAAEAHARDLKYLRKIIGEKAYRALKRGAVLKIWRNSTPHNWWIEGKRGKMYWHSESEGPNRFSRPPLKFFDKVSDSGERVIAYWGSDSGQPCESTFVLKEKL